MSELDDIRRRFKEHNLSILPWFTIGDIAHLLSLLDARDEVCSCEEWDENIRALNGLCTMLTIRGGQYSGKPFTHCPWCGGKRK